jgi:hypothetical protein
LVLEAGGASALAAAATALDLALERGLRSPHGRGAVLVSRAEDAWLARSIVLRGARRGLLTVLLWRARDAAGAPVHGRAIAGPCDGGAWYAEGPITAHGESFAESLACSAGWAALREDAFLIACMRLGGQGAPADATQTDARMAMDAAQNGVRLDRVDYAALLEAGKALLVPEAVEHLVLHEGANPLKSF